MIISGTVFGDREAGVRLRRLDDVVRLKVLEAITGLTFDLQDYVVRQKLSGQVLRRRTGNLADHIYRRVDESDKVIRGVVGTNVPYGRVHEFGYQGPQHIRAFNRTVTTIFGRKVEPATQHVGQFTRHVNIKARPFLHPSLEENRQKIYDTLTRAVRSAAQTVRSGS